MMLTKGKIYASVGANCGIICHKVSFDLLLGFIRFHCLLVNQLGREVVNHAYQMYIYVYIYVCIRADAVIGVNLRSSTPRNTTAFFVALELRK